MSSGSVAVSSALLISPRIEAALVFLLIGEVALVLILSEDDALVERKAQCQTERHNTNKIKRKDDLEETMVVVLLLEKCSVMFILVKNDASARWFYKLVESINICRRRKTRERQHC